jgi:hypothetical protein
MRRIAAAAVLSASILAMAVWAGRMSASPDDIDRIGPADPAAPPWSGDRMRDARDRLKDILPGRRS